MAIKELWLKIVMKVFCDSYNCRLHLFLWRIITKVIYRNTFLPFLSGDGTFSRGGTPSQTMQSNCSSVAGTVYADLSHPEMGFKKTQRSFF